MINTARGLNTNDGYHPVEQLTMFKRAPQVEIGPGVLLSCGIFLYNMVGEI